MAKESERLGTAPVLPLLVKLSIPPMIGMAVQALYNIVDSIYVGHVSKSALSALSLAFPIQMILIAIALGTGIGTSSLISRLLGKNKKQRADNAAEHAIFVAVLCGILSAVIGLFFAQDIIKFFTNNSVLVNLGTKYIRIILLGSTTIFFVMTADNILRGQGNTFIPMVNMLIGAITNVIIDPFLIFGLWIFPELGVEGAAYSTILANLISSSFAGIILFTGRTELDLKMQDFKFDLGIIKDIYQVGFPAMMSQLLSSIAIAGINKIVGAYSETAIAVMGIYFRLRTFAFMPIIGLNQGFMPLIGYNYGHKNFDRIKKGIKYGVSIAIAISLVGAGVFQIFTKQLLALFNKDPELIKMGVVALRRISLSFPMIALGMIGIVIFQAFGKGLSSLILNFFRQIIFLLPVTYILGKVYNLKVLWFGFPLSQLLTSALVIVWLTITLNKIFKTGVSKEAPQT